MGRPTSKSELLSAASEEFERLWVAVDSVAPARREVPGACEAWSVKDLLAHLHAWQQMAIEWEKVGSAGEKPTIPADGFTFAETPALNEVIYRRTENDDWADIASRLRATHAELMATIDSYDSEDLFAKSRYPWTRTTSVGAYMVSATSSHYAWASKLIRKWAKNSPADLTLPNCQPGWEAPTATR